MAMEGAGVGVPGCEGLQGEKQHFQAGQRTCDAPLVLRQAFCVLHRGGGEVAQGSGDVEANGVHEVHAVVAGEPEEHVHAVPLQDLGVCVWGGGGSVCVYVCAVNAGSVVCWGPVYDSYNKTVALGTGKLHTLFDPSIHPSNTIS